MCVSALTPPSLLREPLLRDSAKTASVRLAGPISHAPGGGGGGGGGLAASIPLKEVIAAHPHVHMSRALTRPHTAPSNHRSALCSSLIFSTHSAPPASARSANHLPNPPPPPSTDPPRPQVQYSYLVDEHGLSDLHAASLLGTQSWLMVVFGMARCCSTQPQATVCVSTHGFPTRWVLLRSTRWACVAPPSCRSSSPRPAAS